MGIAFRSTHPTRRATVKPVAAPGRFCLSNFRFFDFGEILPRIEIDEDWREHLGYRRRSAICNVEARKSKCAAQLESLRLLASSDFQGSVEGIFGGGNVRWVKTQQKLTVDAMQFGIEPMLAGLFRPGDQLPQNFQPSLKLPCLCIRHGNLHPPKWFTKVAVIFVK